MQILKMTHKNAIRANDTDEAQQRINRRVTNSLNKILSFEVEMI